MALGHVQDARSGCFQQDYADSPRKGNSISGFVVAQVVYATMGIFDTGLERLAPGFDAPFHFPQLLDERNQPASEKRDRAHGGSHAGNHRGND